MNTLEKTWISAPGITLMPMAGSERCCYFGERLTDGILTDELETETIAFDIAILFGNKKVIVPDFVIDLHWAFVSKP